jgi:hypothetical protein
VMMKNTLLDDTTKLATGSLPSCTQHSKQASAAAKKSVSTTVIMSLFVCSVVLRLPQCSRTQTAASTASGRPSLAAHPAVGRRAGEK